MNKMVELELHELENVSGGFLPVAAAWAAVPLSVKFGGAVVGTTGAAFGAGYGLSRWLG